MSPSRRIRAVALVVLVAVLCMNRHTERTDARQPGAEKRPDAPPDKKRGQPEVLLPVEGKIAVVHAQVWSYIFVTDRNEKIVIMVADTSKKQVERPADRLERERLAKKLSAEGVTQLRRCTTPTALPR